MLFIWPWKGDAQGGVVALAGLPWHPGDGRLPAVSHQGKSQSGPGSSTRIPAATDSPHLLVANGTCPQCVPLGMWQQTLSVITSNL